MELSHYKDTWGLDLAVCPCDLHFAVWLEMRALAGKAVFHFGTGSHHLLAIENAKRPQPNHIFGVTASRGEYDSYVDLILERAEIAATYKAMFVDIYTFDRRELPRFDAVSLFHLCEFWRPEMAAYAPLDDARLLDLMIERLVPGGRVLFYLGSNDYERAAPLIDAAIAAGAIADEETFLALRVCRKP